MDDLHVIIAQQRIRIEQLEAEIAYLKETVDLSSSKLQRHFHLTKLEAATVSKFLDGRVTSKYWLADNLCVKEDVNPNTTAVRMVHIRRKIAPYKIINHWGLGYQIPDGSLIDLRKIAEFH